MNTTMMISTGKKDSERMKKTGKYMRPIWDCKNAILVEYNMMSNSTRTKSRRRVSLDYQVKYKYNRLQDSQNNHNKNLL